MGWSIFWTLLAQMVGGGGGGGGPGGVGGGGGGGISICRLFLSLFLSPPPPSPHHVSQSHLVCPGQDYIVEKHLPASHSLYVGRENLFPDPPPPPPPPPPHHLIKAIAIKDRDSHDYSRGLHHQNHHRTEHCHGLASSIS